MSNTLILLVTLLYEGAELVRCVLLFDGDEVPSSVHDAPMEPESRAWIRDKLPLHLREMPILEVSEEIADVVDLRHAEKSVAPGACMHGRMLPAKGPTIVGFYGKAGAGKTTAATVLEDIIGGGHTPLDLSSSPFYPVSALAFADPIKEIARQSFGWDGEKDERGRKLLQVIGTECGRHYNENIWIDKTMAKVDVRVNGRPTSNLYIIHDVRFENEALAILGRGGVIVEVTGRAHELGANAGHASERGLARQYITHTIDNSGTLMELRAKLEDLLTWLPLPNGGER